MKPIISFDIDGVLADGKMIDWHQQKDHPEIYSQLKNLMPSKIWNELTLNYHIYLVSSRSFPSALEVTLSWLQQNQLTPAFARGVILNQAFHKAAMVRMLGSQLHIDDDPAVVKELGVYGVLFRNPYWAASCEYYDRFGGVTNWKEAEDYIGKNI